MDVKAAVGSLGALAQQSRLLVFRLLVQGGPAGLAAGEISRRTGIPPTTLSFHLSQLSRAGLVQARRAGRLLIYSAGYEQIEALIAFLMDNCCQGAATPAASAGRARTKGRK
jgi:DNA-binding transcriptional ArsR family regulator